MAYTVYSNFSGQGRLPIWSVYKKLEKSGPWAEPVYSKIQGLVRFLVRSVYRKLEKPGQNLYTQIFRIQVRILVVGVYSILEFFRAGKAPDLERIQYTRKVWARAESVYSNFQGQGRLPIWSVYKKLEKSGPGQNLYTRFFRARAGSWSGAYTKSSKSPGPGRTCILKFSGPEQALGLERIQKARKVRARAEPVYSNFPGQSRLSVWSVYKKLEKSGPGQNLYTQIFRVRASSRSIAYTESLKSRAWAEPVYSKIQCSDRFRVWSVYKILEKTGPGQSLYTQIFRARAGSRSGAYTRYSKKLALGRICILKFSGAGQVPDLGRIQKAREVRAQIDSCLLTYTAYSKSQDPGEPDSYHIEYTALALHYKHQSSAQTRKRKPIVSTRRV